MWLESLFLTLSDTDPVPTWADASGAGFHLVSNRTDPVYRTGITPNGAPVVRAAGASRMMTASNFWLNESQSFTLFLVARCQVVGGSDMLWSFGDNNNNNPKFWYTLDSTNAYFAQTSNTTSGISYGTGLADGAFRVFSSVFDPTASGSDRWRAWLGKSLVGSISTPSLGVSGGTPRQLTLFGQEQNTFFAFEGDLCAFLWYDDPLSDGDREAVVDYLTARYITTP